MPYLTNEQRWSVLKWFGGLDKTAWLLVLLWFIVLAAVLILLWREDIITKCTFTDWHPNDLVGECHED